VIVNHLSAIIANFHQFMMSFSCIFTICLLEYENISKSVNHSSAYCYNVFREKYLFVDCYLFPGLKRSRNKR